MSFNASFQDLKNIFNNNICVRDIAESLISFDSEKPAKTVKKFMIEKEFTVVGLRRNGEIEGYVKKDNLLDDGTIDSFSENIDYEISEKAGMMEALNKLKENDYYFVKILNKYGGIVTRSDIEKIPFRLWVYGTISIFEIILLDIIRSNYSNNEITGPLTENRIKLAKNIFNERQRKDYAIDFVECLALPDKIKICILKNKSLLKELELEYEEAINLKEIIINLRNNLAHGSNFEDLRFDELHKKLSDVIPKVSLMTVYRNLNKLVKEGVAFPFHINNALHYCGNSKSHFHLHCVSCVNTVDVYNNDLNKSKK